MKRLRRERGMSIDQLALETGLSADYLKKVEDQEIIPHVADVIRISKALSVSPGAFLSADDASASRKRKREQYAKRTESYAYTALTPDAESKHMMAFLVKIDPLQDHPHVEYTHPGEEFLYVLKGRIEVWVGENKYEIGVGECLHFNSNIPHGLKNISEKPAEVLAVLYTP